MTAASASTVAAKKADNMVATYAFCHSVGADLQGFVGCVKPSMVILALMSTLTHMIMEDQVAKGSIMRKKHFHQRRQKPIDHSSIHGTDGKDGTDDTDWSNNPGGTDGEADFLVYVYIYMYTHMNIKFSPLFTEVSTSCIMGSS